MLQKLLKHNWLPIVLAVSFLTFFFILPKMTSAIMCPDGSDGTECHSLRPYPGVTPTPKPDATLVPSATICGNTVSIIDPIVVEPIDGKGVCTKQLKEGLAFCSYNIHRQVDLTIDLSQAELPIMGNTEDVVNAATSPENETIGGLERINDYVSWYLYGNLSRAEYPYNSGKTVAENEQIASEGGVLRKILPWERLQRVALSIIKRVVNQNADNSLPNQTVGCLDSSNRPIECPTNKEVKIIYWSNRGLFQPADFNRTPPLRETYTNFLEYWKDYLIWRGNSCHIETIPLVNIQFILCNGWLGTILGFDNPFYVNYWSDLFPYIPLSSTEDKQGQFNVNPSVTKQEPDLKLENIDIKSGSSNLYFSHMQEDLDTSTLLQQTFTAKGEVGKIISDYVSPKIQSGCKILQTRTNSGDNLYANGQLVDTSASFNAVFNCTFQLDDQGNYIPGSSCTRTPVVTFAVSTKTPLANNTFSNLVVGSNSIVRRIFPKIGVDSLIGSFYDIPASTTVTYSGAKEGTGNIYIPHVGSVDEYFLKGIQTLLRPKGYGEQITFAAPGHKYASCGTAFAQFNPPSSTTDKAKSYFDLYIKQYLTDDLISIYAEAEKQTGLPCEVFAGVHFREGSNDPNRDLESGAPLNGRSLLDSAIKVGNEILGKMGGSITTWDELSEALSRYNGLGNHNCPPQIPPLPYSVPYSTCPAKYMGEDDPYSLAWIDSNHENMFLIWCADGIQCTSLTEFPDPGALTVATEMYLSKIR